MSSTAYNVGKIEASLEGVFDERAFDKFDRAMDRAVVQTKELTADQKKQATQMRATGASYKEIGKAIGVADKEVSKFIADGKRQSKQLKDTDRQLDKSRRTTDQFGKATGGAANKMKSAIKYAIALAAAYVGIGQAKVAIDTTLEYNKAVTGLNRNLGLSIQAASRWATVAKARDIDTKSLVMSFTALSRKLEDAKGGADSALKPFQALGLEQKDLTEGSQTFEGQLAKVAKALGEAEGGTQRQAAAQQLLGRGYQTVLPLFTEGTKSMKEQLHWADEFGTVLTDKTSKGFSDMVEGERKSKAAMLGLQISFTRVAGPALEYLNKQFQQLTSTMNDPKLTDEQKVNRISAQFEKIVDKVGAVLEKAAPRLAQKGGEIGVRIAKGLATSFVQSGWLGKLAIGAWLISRMGGWGALTKMGAKAGGRVAKGLGMAFLRAVAPYFAADVASQGLGAALATKMPGLTRMFRKNGGKLGATMGLAVVTVGLSYLISKEGTDKLELWGSYMGQQIVNALIAAVNVGIRQINDVLDKANVLGKLGVDAPNIGEIGNVNFDPNKPRKNKQDGPLGDLGLKPLPDDFLKPKRGKGSKNAARAGGSALDLLTGGELGNAAKDNVRDVSKSFDDLDKDANKKTMKTGKTVVKNFQSMRKKSVDSQGLLKRSVRDSWRDIDSDHSERTRSMDETTGKRFKSMFITVKKRGGDMEDAIGSTMSSLEDAVMSGFGNIADTTNKALKAFGVEPVSFGVSDKKVKKHAGGGWIEGQGKQDTVPLLMGMAAPGEAILSGPQQAEVEQSLAMTRAMGMGQYGSLDSLFQNVTTPHYAYAKGGRLGGLKKFASGGFAELNPAAQGLAQQLKGMGFSPTSTYRSDSTTYHGSRDAIDYGDSVNDIGKLWGVLKPRAKQFAELFGPSYLTGPTLMHNGVGFSDSALQAGHEDHIHVAILGALKGGLSMAQIKRQILSGPDGPLKSMGQAALDKVQKSAKGYADKKTAALGMDGPGGSSQIMAWLSAALKITGHYSASNLQDLYGRAMQESGGDPKAINLWDSNAAAGHPSKGLLQTIDSTFDAYKMKGHNNIWNPVDNAIAAIRYMYSRYGDIVGPSGTGYARGGRIGKALRKFTSGGRVVQEAAPIMLKAGLLHRAAAAMLGNSYGESGWNTESMEPGTNNGGLFGFTATPVSFPEMQGYASRTGQDWRDVKPQVQFALHDLKNRLPSTFAKMNEQTIPEATSTFMHEWERPANYSSLGKRINAGFDASKIMRKMNLGGGANKPSGLSGRPITEGMESARAAWKKKAARKARWSRLSKSFKTGRKSSKEGLALPHFMRPFRPKIGAGDQAAVLGAHSPIGGDLDAYNLSFDMLAQIDPELAELRDRYLGTYDADTKQSVWKRQERLRRQQLDAIERLKKKMKQALDLKIGGGPTGGVRPKKKDGKFVGGRASKVDKVTEKVLKKQYERALKKGTARIRKKFNPADAMKPVTAQRSRIQERFDTLSERGESMSELLSQAQGNVRQTIKVSNAGRKALAGNFARGGRVGPGVAMPTAHAPDPIIEVNLRDPVLQALDPHIEVKVNGRIRQTGQSTRQRQRQPGSAGRKAKF